MKRAPKSNQANHSPLGSVDILLPLLLEKRWAERIQPLLETLGVPKSTKFQDILGDSTKVRLWSMRVNRPKVGSVVVPQKSGNNYRCGEATVRFEEGGERASKDDPAIIKSVYGVSAMAVAAPPQAKQQAEWEEVPLLAVTNDFVTLVADILPGKDTFVAVELWANAVMPVFALAQRPSALPPQHSLREFRSLDTGDVELIRMCETCHSSGKVECKKCGGKGQWQPEGVCRKCNGQRNLTCTKCGGSGRVECRRCNGSGDFIGKRGDRLDCRTCAGTGTLTCNNCGGAGDRECFVCKGTGEPPILDCNACSGTGKWDCISCGGTGALRVQFQPYSGSYLCGRSQIAPREAEGWDALANRGYNLDQGARLFLERLEAQAQATRDQQEKLRSIQKEIAPIENCLNLAMQAQQKPMELFNFRPVELGKPEATTERAKGRLILAFPLSKPPAWAREGRPPFDLGTPVRFTEDSVGQMPIDLKRQPQKASAKPMDPAFWGLDVRPDKHRLLVSFPTDVDISSIPERCYLRPDVIPPAEMAQLKELGKWCSMDRPVPQLSALALPETSGSVSTAPTRVATANPAILENPRQQEALDWIMSDAPLVLVKGPPGTGKTTVITEAVLQCIARGQKILVCSETHQAVANVLERLHKDGRIRMLRHARQDSTKLIDLEREYLEGGSRLAFLQEIRDLTARQVEKLQDRLKKLETFAAALPTALAASENLERSRDAAAKEIQFAEQQYEAQFAAIEAEMKDSCKKAQTRYALAEAKLKKELSDTESSYHSLKKRIHALEKEKASAESAYKKKTGEEPDPSYSGMSPWYKLPWLTPNILASIKLLNERYAKACSELDAAAKSSSEHIRVMEELKKNLALSDSQRIEELAIAANQEQSAKSAAISQRDSLKEAAEARLRADNAHLLPSQDLAAGAWNAVNGVETIVADLPPKQWESLSERADAALKRANEVKNFCRRWHDATESAQSALSRIFWNTTDVFLSTCVGLASWRSFAEHFGREGVDLAIIDEAAHVTLTQTLIPMGRAKRVILIGDEMQLPPAPPMELEDKCETGCRARCRIAKNAPPSGLFKPTMSDCWLERSAFEWISETRPSIPKVMLNRQFRMHPDIADFVADVFYGGSLENGVSVADRELSFGVFGKAVCLIPTTAYKDRYETIPAGATSYQNPLEVEMTRRVLNQARQYLTVPTSIGVLTPYAAQKDLMRRELSSFYVDHGNMLFHQEDVASVDSFQGSERDVMIASFVRSPRQEPRICRECNGTGTMQGNPCSKCGGTGWLGPKLNWVHDLRRLNVAFSRARKMLILIGDVGALTNPKLGGKAGREVLERFGRHVQNRGKVLHVWEEPAYE